MRRAGTQKKRVYFLISLIAVVALLVCASAVYALYQAALKQQEQQLAEMVKGQARLIESVARHDARYRPPEFANAADATISQVLDSLMRSKGFGETGGFMLARREGDRIVFLFSQRDELHGHSESVPFVGTRAEPMRRALNGQSGVTVAADYRGATVLAAYEPVRELGVGLVAKIDLAEVRAPYVRAGTIAGLLAAAVVFGGLLVIRTAEPLLQRLREREAMLVTAQEMAHMGCWSFDIAANKVVWSDELYRVFGYEPRSFTPSYELFVGHIHPDDRQRIVAAIADARERGGPFACSYRLRRADGIERIVESHGQTFTNDRGEVTRLFGVTQDVTERKQAEEKVRDMARFPEQSPHPVMRARQDGTLIYGNKASDRLRDRLGIQMGDPLPPEWMAVSIAAVKEQSSRTFEVACDDRHFMFVVWLIADADYVNFYGMDITEREQAKAALRASEERYRMLMEDAADAIFIADADGNYLSVNARACELLGYTREELLRMNVRDVIPAGDPPSRHEELRNGGPLLTERRLRRKDGGFVHVEIGAKLLPDGRLQVIVRDITARRRDEAQMRKLSNALERSTDAVMITDREGVIEYVNPAFEAMTGYGHAEILGRKPSLLRSGVQGETFYRRLWSNILAGEIFTDVFVNRRKDGSLYHEEKTITPIKDANGHVAHFVSTGRDVTDRVQAQEQLQFLAHHDGLTELPNRVLFLDRFKQALAHARWHERRVAAIFLDLDGFKNINDSLGHDIGDLLLQQLAARLRTSVRERDTVARLGGDEFAILLDDLAWAWDVGPVAGKVLDALAAPFVASGRDLSLTASLGVSLYPDDGEDAATLLKCADAAMYRAKSLGKNNFQFYSSA